MPVCPHCSHDNKSRTLRCEECQESLYLRPPEADKPVGWQSIFPSAPPRGVSTLGYHEMTIADVDVSPQAIADVDVSPQASGEEPLSTERSFSISSTPNSIELSWSEGAQPHPPADEKAIHKAFSQDPLLGRMLGNFRIQHKVGQGGFGAVYKAEHIHLRQPYAVKILQLQEQSPEVVERFRREAVALARLQHDHIVHVSDFGIIDGIACYLVMEFVEGKDLRLCLKDDGAFELQRVYDLMKQFTSVLSFVHDKGIVHRDIKPSNVLLMQDPHKGERLKLLDFGIAAFSEEQLSLTQTGVMMGSPSYISPEQAKGERKIDGRSDLYSLGIIAYCMLTGKKPFRAANMAGMIGHHLFTAPPALRERAPQRRWAPALEDFIQKALSKEPEDRFFDAKEFWEALAPALEAQRSLEGDGPEPLEAPAPTLKVASQASEPATQEALPALVLPPPDPQAPAEEATIQVDSAPEALALLPSERALPLLDVPTAELPPEPEPPPTLLPPPPTPELPVTREIDPKMLDSQERLIDGAHTVLEVEVLDPSGPRPRPPLEAPGPAQAPKAAPNVEAPKEDPLDAFDSFDALDPRGSLRKSRPWWIVGLLVLCGGGAWWILSQDSPKAPTRASLSPPARGARRAPARPQEPRPQEPLPKPLGQAGLDAPQIPRPVAATTPKKASPAPAPKKASPKPRRKALALRKAPRSHKARSRRRARRLRPRRLRPRKARLTPRRVRPTPPPRRRLYEVDDPI